MNVELNMKFIKNGKSDGPEDTTAELPKRGSKELQRMMTIWFNEYLDGHPEPDALKTAYITTICKKVDIN